MKAAAVFIFALVAIAAAPAQAQIDTTFLNNPVYAPFIEIVLSQAGVCLSDPAILGGKFSLEDCPGLNDIMQALYNNETNIPVECQPSCVTVFGQLSPACSTALRTAFSTGTSEIATLGSAFFADCDATSSGPSSAPTPAPVPAPPVPSPVPSPILPSPILPPKPSPTLPPAPPASSAACLSAALAAAVATIALMA